MNPALQELRDIHLPPPVSWWPLAPGWWIVIGWVFVTIVVLLLWQRKRRRAWRQEAWRREALQQLASLQAELPGISTQLAMSKLSILIRRVMITCFPRHDVASLYGERWLAFLELSMGEVAHADEFRSAGGSLLIEGPYQPRSSTLDSAQSLQPLLALLERWLHRLSIQQSEQSERGQSA
jgi:hypothetical protein